MSQTSEAACLLQSGALYFRRLGLRGPEGRLTFAGRKRGAFSLYFDDEPIYHFDLEGRWQRAYVGGVHYRKSLAGSVDAIERPREGANLVLRRRALPYAEVADLDAAIREVALDLIDAVGRGRVGRVGPAEGVGELGEEELRDLLERIGRWDAAAWFAERERYAATYGPLPLLPPDCHQSVVLQATLGHAGGRPFGGGPAAEHYIRSPAEFAEHARDVRALWGRRLIQANGVFLAGADVLHQPLEWLDTCLTAVGEVFPIGGGAGARPARGSADEAIRLGGIDAFLDDFRTPLPDRDGWARLARGGLRRVNLGVESGDPAVRSRGAGTWSDDDLCNAVAEMKAAGLELRVLTIVGAGGRARGGEHRATTAELLTRLDLGRGDLVYLLDERELGGGAAEDRLGAAEWDAAQAELKARLAPIHSERGVKVVPYSLEKQWN